MADSEVRRGDVWWLDWEPARGSAQAGFRPGLVIQNDVGNRAAPTTIVAAITTRGRRLPVIVPLGETEAGLPEPSFVHTGQIAIVDRSQLVRHVGRAGQQTMQEVDQAIRISLGLLP